VTRVECNNDSVPAASSAFLDPAGQAASGFGDRPAIDPVRPDPSWSPAPAGAKWQCRVEAVLQLLPGSLVYLGDYICSEFAEGFIRQPLPQVRHGLRAQIRRGSFEMAIERIIVVDWIVIGH